MKNCFNGTAFKIAFGQSRVRTPEHRIDKISIAQLTLNQGHSQYVLHNICVAVDKVVEHGNLVASPREGSYGMTADVAGSPRHQNSHGSTFVRSPSMSLLLRGPLSSKAKGRLREEGGLCLLKGHGVWESSRIKKGLQYRPSLTNCGG